MTAGADVMHRSHVVKWLAAQAARSVLKQTLDARKQNGRRCTCGGGPVFVADLNVYGCPRCGREWPTVEGGAPSVQPG